MLIRFKRYTLTVSSKAIHLSHRRYDGSAVTWAAIRHGLKGLYLAKAESRDARGRIVQLPLRDRVIGRLV